jgi:hypothetical protein
LKSVKLLAITSIAWSLIAAPSAFGVDFIKGSISKEDNKFFIENAQEKLEIKTSDKILKSLPSLFAPSFVTQSNGSPYSFEFKGERDEGAFYLSEVPTNIPGSEAIRGLVTYNNSTNQYYVGQTAVRYGYTKELNGYKFDEISKRSFIDKEVIAEGEFDSEGILIMQALTPTNLFSASIPHKPEEFVTKKLSNIGPKKFILKEMVKNSSSQQLKSFRSIIYQKKNTKVSYVRRLAPLSQYNFY